MILHLNMAALNHLIFLKILLLVCVINNIIFTLMSSYYYNNTDVNHSPVINTLIYQWINSSHSWQRILHVNVFSTQQHA